MEVIVINKSKKKSFIKTKRIINTLLPQVDLRINIGDLPLRVFEKMVEELRKSVNRGTEIKVFIKENGGFCGYKLIEIGKKRKNLKNFT